MNSQGLGYIRATLPQAGSFRNILNYLLAAAAHAKIYQSVYWHILYSFYFYKLNFNYCLFYFIHKLIIFEAFIYNYGLQIFNQLHYCCRANINKCKFNNFIAIMSERIDILTNNQNLTPPPVVVDAYSRLNREIDDMNGRIGATIDKNEAEFLLAYQNHLRKIHIEMSELKNKTDAHEKEMNKNDRAILLERQVVIFRQQALRLYERLDKKTQQAEIFKFKCKELEKAHAIAQKQIKEYAKEKKMIQVKLIQAQAAISQLQVTLKKYQEQTRKAVYSEQSNSKTVHLHNLNIRLRDQQNRINNANKTISLGMAKKSLFNTTGFSNFKAEDYELKNWFLQCIKAIKRDVAQRKQFTEQLNLDYIRTIDEFKMVDKLRLLQKFMENQKLLIWMYEKIFPSRISEVRQYFALKQSTNKNQQNIEQPINKLQLFDEPTEDKAEISLPKMVEHKKKQIKEARRRVSVIDGKLNMTLT